MRKVSFIFLKCHLFFAISGFTFFISFENNQWKHYSWLLLCTKVPLDHVIKFFTQHVVYFLTLNDLLHKIHVWGCRSYAYIFYFVVPHHYNASLREAGLSFVISAIISQNDM